MCDHCSCRQFPAIAELSEEHEAILGVAWELSEEGRSSGADEGASERLLRMQLELFPAAMFGFEDDDWAVLDATDRFVARAGAARQT